MKYLMTAKDNEMKKNPLVTIVVPIYNISNYLVECLDSILKQSYSDLEIILVNDGSTDSSTKICEMYAKKDCRITVINKENGGLVSARKAGIERATGDFLINVDGDDWIDSNMVSEMVNLMMVDNFDFIQCGYVEHGKKVESHLFETNSFILLDDVKTDLLKDWLSGGKRIGSQIFTKIFRTDFIKEGYNSVPNDMSMGEDFLSHVIFLSKASKVYSTEVCLYHYRVRQGSLSHSDDELDFLLKEERLTYEMVRLFDTYFPKLNKDIVRKWVLKRKIMCLRQSLKTRGINVMCYQYPDVNSLFGKKVVIYGAGAVGRDFIMQLSEYTKIDIVGWVDKNYGAYDYSFREVESVLSLSEKEYDVLIVAIQNIDIAKEIHDELVDSYSISEDQIVWEYNRDLFVG